MKIYDKEIYNKEQSIKTIVFMIVVFLLGFFTGFAVNNLKEPQDTKIIEDNNIENVQNYDLE